MLRARPCLAGTLCLALAACHSARSQTPDDVPQLGKQGMQGSVSCEPGQAYEFEHVTPLGHSAKSYVETYGSLRSAVEVGHSPRTLNFEFSRRAGTINYSSTCGRLTIPITLSAKLSEPERWLLDATLTVNPSDPFELQVSAKPTERAPFYLNLSLSGRDIDARLEPTDGRSPMRFTTLCKSPTAAIVKSALGVDVEGVIAGAQGTRLECVIPGRQALSIDAPKLTLVDFDSQVCRASPGAPMQFSLKARATSDWASPTMQGVVNLTEEATRVTVRYELSSTQVPSDAFVPLVPCAGSDIATVRLEGGVTKSKSGSEAVEREPQTLFVAFKCEDVIAECRAKRP